MTHEPFCSNDASATTTLRGDMTTSDKVSDTLFDTLR